MRRMQVILIVFAGVAMRFLFVSKGLFGDILPFAEWGSRYWVIGARDFYNSSGWYYSFPTYFPPAMLLFAFLNWVNQHSFVLAMLHNAIKIVPSSFVRFF